MIGVSRKDITPPVEIYSRNWGAAEFDTAAGIHRPLILVCISFRSSAGETPLLLFSADLGVWRNLEDWKDFQAGFLKALSIPPSQLMFCLSHTHSGPSLCSTDLSRKGGELVKPYLLLLQQQAIDAAWEALSNATPATLTWQYGKCSLATNRDLFEGQSGRFLVGFNPEIEADDTVLVGRITDRQDKITATIVNYACHPTTLAWDNRLISPDYVGAMRELLEEKTQSPCLFLQGASGELAPAEQYVGDTSIADKHGRQLGYAVLSTLESMPPPKKQFNFIGPVESGAPLAIWEFSGFPLSNKCTSERIEIELPLKSFDIAEIERQYNECEDRVLKERLWRKLNTRKNVGNRDFVKFSVWLWQLGDSFLVAHAAEAYSAVQLDIRKDFPANVIGVINLANGGAGYLPVASLYEKDIYQVWHSPFASGSLEILVENIIENIKGKLALKTV